MKDNHRCNDYRKERIFNEGNFAIVEIFCSRCGKIIKRYTKQVRLPRNPFNKEIDDDD